MYNSQAVSHICLSHTVFVLFKYGILENCTYVVLIGVIGTYVKCIHTHTHTHTHTHANIERQRESNCHKLEVGVDDILCHVTGYLNPLILGPGVQIILGERKIDTLPL